MAGKVDAYRVATDAAYAARLSPAEWSTLRHDPEFQELIDTRGRFDVESPLGEWTRVECICNQDRITVVVNGAVVNECFDVFPSKGKILLESEGFEIYFRRFELRPLTKSG